MDILIILLWPFHSAYIYEYIILYTFIVYSFISCTFIKLGSGNKRKYGLQNQADLELSMTWNVVIAIFLNILSLGFLFM